MGNQASQVALAAGYFWNDPEIKKIGKIAHPNMSYKVGEMYRGNKSIITADELCSAIKIMKAFRRYKKKNTENFNK